jgi:cytochrome c556
MKRIVLLGAGLALVTAAVFAQDKPPFEMEIKARQGLMSINALNIGILYKMSRGDTPYDAVAAKSAADAIVGVYNLDLPMLWPEGSDNTINPATRAQPAIWDQSSSIGEKAKAWETAALAMQAAAGTDQASLKAAFPALDQACSGCHKAFRAAAN